MSPPEAAKPAPALVVVSPALIPAPLDSDKDGIVDENDKCPGTASAVAVDAQGCPLDSDKDGIIDSVDQCPNTKFGLAVDRKGCPPPIEENVKIAIGVLFATGKADINEDSTEDIKKLGDFMQTYPTTTTVIEGHTDNVGSTAQNKELSQQRAEAVRDYLTKNYSIEPNRITAVGYGSERPIADNATAEGRKMNRRIEAAVETVILKPQE
jgi:OOP family OmpA-OmpF porin